MHRFILYIFALLLSFSLASCSSVPSDSEKLEKITPQEYENLCKYAKKLLYEFPEDKITRDEKAEIIKTEPKFTANYFDDKFGTYDLSWTLNNKTINYLGDGDMTNPQKSYSRVIIIVTGVEPPSR